MFGKIMDIFCRKKRSVVEEAQKAELRRAFHGILNQLHSITITAGSVLEDIKAEGVGSLSESELRERLKECREALKDIENLGEASGGIIEKLKTKIYGMLQIDASKPME